MRIALAQVNTTTGDLNGNAEIVRQAIREAQQLGADLVALPELVITGYPPDDLLLNKAFVRDSESALLDVARGVEGIVAIIGFPEASAGALYNSAAVAADGAVRAVYRKHKLPNYGVFDERRFFEPGQGILLGDISGVRFGVIICEDLWEDEGPSAACARAGASIVVNINASPYHAGKTKERLKLLHARARRQGVAFAYVNSVGGNDEIIFDGQSMAVDAEGQLLARGPQFRSETIAFDFTPRFIDGSDPPTAGREEPVSTPLDEPAHVVDVTNRARSPKPRLRNEIAPELSHEEEVYSALVLGVRDYMAKNGFHQALVGVSGGIDSALTLSIAVDAIGADNVLAISNPSGYTSERSVTDAAALCANLQVELAVVPIGDVLDSMRKALTPVFKVVEGSVTDQNLQARIRGNLWMAVSNQTGRLVLSTGNKSEMAVGYATLYGDMAGGFAVLKDVPKTLVWQLARWRNRRDEVIPASIIERPPSAELAPNQLDTDLLPPYEILDPILKAYVEDALSIDEITWTGFDRETVAKVVRMVDRAEYKRRQAPPGIKISPRAFGRDRRLPITNGYRPL
ncbi:MAG: NAD+ synthase [Actinomycetota bacterium]|nr:NAD+ synthase [Actinomycetota bacterium]